MLWVDCSSEAAARADFKTIGSLCGWALDESDLLHGVKDQLASLDRPSLLLLDNCDDTTTNFNRYIPNSAQVSVVLTTRLSDADKYASLDPHDTTQRLLLRMDGLDPASATQLILEASATQQQSDETVRHAERIADFLDYHPLAIIIASSLIQSNVYSIIKYAGALEDRLTQKELLDTETEQATYRKVSATFEISATVLQEYSVSDESAQHALDLLDLMAFMYHRDVSEDIFVRARDYEEVVLSSWMKQDREPEDLSLWHVAQARKYFSYGTVKTRTRALLKARAHLIRLTLVKLNFEGNTTYMHSMVHLWARERLRYSTKTWASVASLLALSAQGCKGWQHYASQLSLHCEANFRAIQNDGGIQLHGERICRIWCNFAWQMLYAGHLQTPDVVKYLWREVRSQSHLAADDPLVTEPQFLLGWLATKNGEALEAVAILEDVNKIRAKLAEHHPARLNSKLLLARAYLQEGRISQAIEILEHVAHVRGKLADDHPARLASLHELACAILRDGRISRAIEILEHVVQTEEMKLAADHPDRLASQHELARAYLQDGRTSQAIEKFEYVVRMSEKLAASHPDRLRSQHELARAYWSANRFVEADKLMSYVVDVERRTLPEGHRERIVSEEALAMIREDPENPAAVSEDLRASADQEPGDAHEDDTPSNL